MALESVSVRKVSGSRDVRTWIRVPHEVYANDPHWVSPLHLVERQRISAKHNPFFKFGEAAFFIAERHGVPAGRISAQINHAHLAHHAQATGHFGFFDCCDDQAVANALLEAAQAWLGERGVDRMLGPMSLNINQEVGLLVDGFGSPPAFMMGHASRAAGRLLSGGGLTKAMDLLAFRMSPKVIPSQIARLARFARESRRIAVRQLDMRNFSRDVRLVLDIFNDGWSENWGFVPFQDCEVEHLIAEMRPIMRGKFGRIVEIDGSPAAMMVALPDLNDVVAPFNGRLLPFNWLRLARAIRRDRWRTARILLLGVRKEHRHTPLATAVLSLLAAEFLELGRAYDLEWVEFSWILESNAPMMKLAELTAGPPCKTYRLYEKAWG